MFTQINHWIASAGDGIWKFIFFCGAASLFGLWRYFVGLRRSRLVENVPRSLLRSAAQGYIELSGTAHQLANAPVTGPLTGKSCVWYKFAVAKRHEDSKGNTSWSTIDSGTSRDFFQLRDETGQCLVNPDGAEVITKSRDEWRGGTRMPTSPPGGARQWSSGDYRYTETRLVDGETLFILGDYQTQSLAQSDDAATAELLHKWKLDRTTLIQRYDANRDGTIDAAEWDAVRSAAVNEARRLHSDAAAEPESFVAKPHERDRPFLISAFSETELVSSYRSDIWIGLTLFLLGGTACVWMAGIRIAGS
jgi:hypothetical protein